MYHINKLLHVSPLNKKFKQMNIIELLFILNILKEYVEILFLALAQTCIYTTV